MAFFNITRFGGLYDGDPELDAPPNSAKTAKNVLFISEGMRPQFGIDRLVLTKLVDSSGGSNFATALYDYQDGASQHVLAISGDTLQELASFPGHPTSWITIHSGIAVAPAVIARARMDFETGFGRCYFQNGRFDPLVYDAHAGSPLSPVVHEWGIDAPTLAPTVIANNAVEAEGGDPFGEMEEFENTKGWWTPPLGGGSNASEGPLGRKPLNWDFKDNIIVNSQESSDTPFQLGKSLQLFCGYERGNSIARGDYKLQQGKSQVYAGATPIVSPNAAIGAFAPAGFPNGFLQSLKKEDDYDEWKHMRDQIKLVGREIKVFNGASFDRSTITSVQTKVSGKLYDLGTDSPISTGGQYRRSFEYYSGPFNGILRRQIPISGIGGATPITIAVTAQVKSTHTGACLRVLGDSGATPTEVCHSGGGDWERLIISGATGHTFSPLDTVGYVEIETKIDPSVDIQTQLDGRHAFFDEVRIVEGAIPPDAGGSLDGHFQYKYVFVDETDDTFSNPSPKSQLLKVVKGTVDVTIPAGPITTLPKHPVTHIYVYRAISFTGSENDLSEFFLIKTIDITTIGSFPFTFTDTKPQVEAEDEGDICLRNIITPPRGEFIGLFEGRMIVTGFYNNEITAPPDAKPSDGRKLWYSEVNQPGVFLSDNFLEIDTKDNNQITGLAFNNGRVWIFTIDQIWEITNLGDQFERANMRHNGIGCANGHSITVFEGRVYFMDRDGIYAMDGGGHIERISRPIDKTYKESINFDLFQVGATVTDKKVWFSSFDFLWCYDLEQGGKWSQMDSGIKIWTIAGVIDGDEKRLLMADNGGYVYLRDDAYESYGVNSGTRSGAATAGGSLTTLVDSGATFESVGNGLDGTFVTVEHRDSDGDITSIERRRIVSNGSTQIVVGTAFGATPAIGDTYILGEIEFLWEHVWLDFGNPSQKKLVKRIKIFGKSDRPAAQLTSVDVQFESDHRAAKSKTITWKAEIPTKWTNARNRGYIHSVGISRVDPLRAPIIKHVEVEFDGKDNNL